VLIPQTLIRHGNRDPLSVDVERALRQAILGGYLKPGNRIIEGDIADQFQVSRGPVREALSNLEQNGLVSRKRHRGTFVNTLSQRDVTEIYTMLALLEGEAASLAINRLTDRDFAVLAGLIESFHQAVVSHDIQFMLETDRTFHGTVIAAADHGLLERTCRKLDGTMAACFLTITTTIPDRSLSIAERHLALSDALRKGDPEEARRQFAAHYTDSLEEMLKAWQDQAVRPKDKRRAG
jgi:DNA-binding GntR family transcriptional regulator